MVFFYILHVLLWIFDAMAPRFNFRGTAEKIQLNLDKRKANWKRFKFSSLLSKLIRFSLWNLRRLTPYSAYWTCKVGWSALHFFILSTSEPWLWDKRLTRVCRLSSLPCPKQLSRAELDVPPWLLATWLGNSTDHGAQIRVIFCQYNIYRSFNSANRINLST